MTKTGPSKQHDYLLFNKADRHASDNGLGRWLVSAKEWEEKAKLAGDVCAIYTPKDELHHVFTDRGELIKPMELRLTGDISGIPALLVQCNLSAERLPDDEGFFVYRLLPEPFCEHKWLMPNEISDEKKNIAIKGRPAT